MAFCLIGKCSSGEGLFLLGCVTVYVHVYGPESLRSYIHGSFRKDGCPCRTSLILPFVACVSHGPGQAAGNPNTRVSLKALLPSTDLECKEHNCAWSLVSMTRTQWSASHSTVDYLNVFAWSPCSFLFKLRLTSRVCPLSCYPVIVWPCSELVDRV